MTHLINAMKRIIDSVDSITFNEYRTCEKKRHPPISGCLKNPPSVIRHQKSRAKRDITDGTGSCWLIIYRSLLMLLAQQVVYGLYRIEGRQGHLDHQGVPVAHGTVPETRKLKGLEFAT